MTPDQQASAATRITETAGGIALAASPVWAVEAQFWAVWLAAVVGGLIALLRLPPAIADFVSWWRRIARKTGAKPCRD
jgi:hypothetical protein